eukprot:m.257538 g.257538  ORF g.257538 m.257538 type:complete len:150 (+) comp25572_c0_seq1:188-637(+)
MEGSALVQIVVVRADLWRACGWSIGSLIAQGAHAAVAALMENAGLPSVQAYTHALPTMRKVIKQVKNEAALRKLSEQLKEQEIIHHLWIEQPENTPTCLATVPLPADSISKPLKKLQLFRDVFVDPKAEANSSTHTDQQKTTESETPSI